jgi:hypothetical protein
MAGIFVCYRRDDTAGFAAQLYKNLREHYGPGYVFRDVATLKPGEPFHEAIGQALSRCHVLLAVIGQRWLTSVDAKGQRRVDNQDDFVRMEIEAAFRRGIRVIPVLVEGATMPRQQDLPESLARLTQLQVCELTDFHWTADIERLIETIGKKPFDLRIDKRKQSGKARTIPARYDVQSYIEAYIAVAKIGADADEAPLFRSAVRKTKMLTPLAMTANDIYRMVNIVNRSKAAINSGVRQSAGMRTAPFFPV